LGNGEIPHVHTTHRNAASRAQSVFKDLALGYEPLDGLGTVDTELSVRRGNCETVRAMNRLALEREIQVRSTICAELGTLLNSRSARWTVENQTGIEFHLTFSVMCGFREMVGTTEADSEILDALRLLLGGYLSTFLQYADDASKLGVLQIVLLTHLVFRRSTHVIR